MRSGLLLLVLLALCACGSGSGPASERSDALVLAVLPDQSPAELRDIYLPLIEYLEQVSSLDLEFHPVSTYEALLEDFAAGRVDLAWFGGLTFVRAEADSDARPLVMRDVDRQFTSCYLTAAGDPRNRIDQFRGERFGFGPQLSTSGHLMPWYFLSRDGLRPEELFRSVVHSAGHDQTAQWVLEGRIDLGVANCSIVERMLQSGRLDAAQVRIMRRTPPYVNYVWATPRSMPESTRTLLRDAFLGLDPSRAEHLALLQSLGASSFYPAGETDFDSVREAVALFDQPEGGGPW